MRSSDWSSDVCSSDLLRGQGPFGILLRDETQYDEFVADGIGRQLGAAVGQPFEGRALGLAKDEEFGFFLIGHLMALFAICCARPVDAGRPPRCDWRTSSQVSLPLP